MDELKKQLKNVSLYDVKAYVRKAQNVVYNYTEMEARVREATNNEPWGASSTLMQKIAAGTYNYREREEIVGMIFRRFTEKSANEWRQIYKSLQLLDYLIKNGSERFVDDSRANQSLITMLRSFHYIDSQGRDQGINVRTKAKKLVELLNNDSQLRAERKKARENAKKFQGVAGGVSSSGGRHGDYDGDFDEEFGTYDNRIFGDGGVYGERYEETRPAASKKQFEEYDVETAPAAAAGSAAAARNSAKSKPTTATTNTVDLFSFDDPVPSSSTGATSAQAPAAAADDDDDFGDFQSSVQQQAQQPQLNNLSSLYSQGTQQQQQQPAQSFDAFGDFTSAASTTTSSGPSIQQPKQDAFSSLFKAASTQVHSSAHKQSQPQTTATPAATPAATSTTSTTTNNNNGEINLLDF